MLKLIFVNPRILLCVRVLRLKMEAAGGQMIVHGGESRDGSGETSVMSDTWSVRVYLHR